MGDLAGNLGVDALALGLLLFQPAFLVRLFVLQRPQFGALGAGFVGELFEIREVIPEVGKQFCAGMGNVAKVVQLARDFVGILAIEHQLDRVRLAGHVLLVEQFAQRSLLCLDIALHRARPRPQFCQGGIDVTSLIRELIQFAVGFAHRPLGFPERVACLGLRLFGLREMLLQRSNAPAQFLEFVLGRGMCRRSKGRKREQQCRASFSSEKSD